MVSAAEFSVVAIQASVWVSGGELRPAGGRQPVVLARALSLSEHFPFRRDPALALEAMERRIQRPMFQAEDVVGRALDVLGDLVPVRRAK